MVSAPADAAASATVIVMVIAKLRAPTVAEPFFEYMIGIPGGSAKNYIVRD
jgi:hypothetical protein